MSLKNESKPTYGVIGSGSFGTAIANILAENANVLLYTRKTAVREHILANRENRGQKVHQNVTPTNNLQEVCDNCYLIFPVVPSANFQAMMRSAAPYLRPDHILIHGTKGLNIQLPEGEVLTEHTPIRREYIQTMTDIIRKESVVLRVGCLSGPNLAKELAAKQPAATVVASRFQEVVDMGKMALRSPRFRVYSSDDVLGVELAGVFKNVMAISAGMLNGLGWGENAKAMLITRGLGEMVKLGQALGANQQAFFGLAGIGDLMATCSSKLSRNFTVGYRLSQGQKLTQIMEDMQEVVEGAKTIKLAKGISLFYKIETPIVSALYDILYNDKSILESIQALMNHGFDKDVDFWRVSKKRW